MQSLIVALPEFLSYSDRFQAQPPPSIIQQIVALKHLIYYIGLY